jgi:hypothetical protein
MHAPLVDSKCLGAFFLPLDSRCTSSDNLLMLFKNSVSQQGSRDV